MRGMRPGRWWQIGEFAALFVVVPIVLYAGRRVFGQWIVPSLLLFGAVCFVALRLDPTFDRRRLWNAARFAAGLRATLLRFVPLALALGGICAFARPDLLLRFPRESPWLWLAVMLLYPLLSVYPQEVIFRAWIFHRYRDAFPTDRWRVAASAVAFAMAHIFFNNWIAPALSLAGGFLFARTYARTRSVLQAGVEHGLWGDFLFTLGLGWYFYGGSIV